MDHSSIWLKSKIKLLVMLIGFLQWCLIVFLHKPKKGLCLGNEKVCAQWITYKEQSQLGKMLPNLCYVKTGF